MLTKEQNDRLTKVGPGTPMGELMRRYWQPIAAYAELSENPTKAIRLLGEDLVLYKDRSGTLGLLEASCAHRRVHLLYGIPEDNGLRCPYHGWLYDSSGQCLEMPAEAPESTFPSRVQLKAYPVEELGGLVFAYLGPKPVPLVPRWGPFVREGVRDIGWAIVGCNWLQVQENSLDPMHGEFLHRYFSNYVLERQGFLKDRGTLAHGRDYVVAEDADKIEGGWRDPAKIAHHTKVGFTIFEHGILKHRLIQGEDEATSPSWRIGHPILIPNYEHGGGGGGFQIRVPMDDTHTYYIWYNVRDAVDHEDAHQAPEDIPVYRTPMPGVDENGIPIWELFDNNSGQDHMAWQSQGPVTQRFLEKLGQSDVGVIMFRRLLNEQMDIVEDGGDPMNVFRDPAKNQEIILHFDGEEGGAANNEDVYGYGGSRSTKVSTGSAGKYSPIGRERARLAGSPIPPTPRPFARDIPTNSPG
ncbi:MAG: Rieske 2Fe-2S domain-containing protein [Chloroflexi bacterium]|nr:Rieske 2Fe-2S domain-containing protein [Chloroflexota bacterium]